MQGEPITDNEDSGSEDDMYCYNDTLMFLTEIPYLEQYSKYLKMSGGIAVIVMAFLIKVYYSFMSLLRRPEKID